MVTKPTENKPEFLVTDPADRVEPSGSKKSAGYDPNEPLPAQSFNWLLYSISLWIAYLEDKTDVQGAGVGSVGFEYVNDPTAIDNEDDGKTFLSDNEDDTLEFQLPDPTTVEGQVFTIKDTTGFFGDNPVMVLIDGAENFEGLNEDYELASPFGTWNIYCDGVDWFLI